MQPIYMDVKALAFAINEDLKLVEIHGEKHDKTIPTQMFAGVQTAFYEGAVKAKERPRFTKTGKTYTPEDTRKFEASVAEWGKRVFAHGRFSYPIKVRIDLHEKTTDTNLLRYAPYSIVYNDKGDVDNYGKGILDGLNKIAWNDDKLIVNLQVSRRWSHVDGFFMHVQRDGLNKFEYENFIKYMRLLEAA